MSRRTVTRFTLVASLALSLTTTAIAQAPPAVPTPRNDNPFTPQNLKPAMPPAQAPAVAPMPQPTPDFQIEFGIDDNNLDKMIPRMPLPVPPCCAFDCPVRVQVETGPMPRVQGQAPTYTGAMVLDWKFSEPANPIQQVAYPERYSVPARQPVLAPFAPQVANGSWMKPGTANGDIRAFHPLVGVTTIRWDENGGGWWVETVRMPQPKYATPVPCPTQSAVPCQIQFTEACPAPRALHAPALPAHRVIEVIESTVAGKSVTASGSTLNGTWFRNLDGLGISVAATFTGDEMTLCLTQSGEGFTVVLTVLADYTLTKSGLVHGVITGVDVDVKLKGDAKDTEMAAGLEELVSMTTGLHAIVDCPFSFRVKNTSMGMMVSTVKFADLSAIPNRDFLSGMYKFAADGKVPAPKPLVVEAKTTLGGLTHPSARYLEHPPQYYSPDSTPSIAPAGATMPAPVKPCVEATPTMTLPAPPCLTTPAMAPPCVPPCQVMLVPAVRLNPAKPVNVPPGDFDAMTVTFGQMLGGNAKPTTCLPMLPSPTVQTLSYTAPLASPASATPGVVGTWVREVGPLVYVVKIAPDHITVTARAAVELPEGKTYGEGIVMSADYHLTRDGTTLVGLITGIDILIEGDVPNDDGSSTGDDLLRVQKLFEDKPFALSVRQHGDALVIGNVRLPGTGDARGMVYSLTVLGGRYTLLGDKPAPKPKAMKMPAYPTPTSPIPYNTPQYGASLPPNESDRLPPLPTIPPIPSPSVTPPVYLVTPSGGMRPIPYSSPAIVPCSRTAEADLPPIPVPTPTMPVPTMTEPTPTMTQPVPPAIKPNFSSRYPSDRSR